MTLAPETLSGSLSTPQHEPLTTPIQDTRRTPDQAPTSSEMELLFADAEYRYYRFDYASVPDYPAMVELINEAWMFDYGASGQAVFKYDEEYLRWMLQKDVFDAIWVTTESGAAAGLMIMTRRTMSTSKGDLPTHYASLFSISSHHRRAGLGRKILELYFYAVSKGTHALFGVMDGESGGKKTIANFHVRDGQKHGDKALYSHFSRSYTLWAACTDMAMLLRYSPMPGAVGKILGQIAVNPLVRKLIEFRYKEPSHKDYTVALVDPFGVDQAPAVGLTTFSPDTVMLKQYDREHSNAGGTYRVTFADGKICEFYYTIHKIVKAGLPDALAGHIQLVDQGTATAKQVRRGLKIATNELCKRGCVGVLIHHTGMTTTAALLGSFFLPSDRKIHYYLAYDRAVGPEVILDGKLYFDLL